MAHDGFEKRNLCRAVICRQLGNFITFSIDLMKLMKRAWLAKDLSTHQCVHFSSSRFVMKHPEFQVKFI